MTDQNDEKLARQLQQTLQQARPNRAVAQQLLAARQNALHHAAATRPATVLSHARPWLKWAMPALTVLVLAVYWQTMRYEPAENNLVAEQWVDDVLLDSLDS
jgi:hypothetical protein